MPTRFFDGMPPREPSKTVIVVPTLAPITSAAPMLKSISLLFNAVSTIAMLAELDCMRAVSSVPAKR